MTKRTGKKPGRPPGQGWGRCGPLFRPSRRSRLGRRIEELMTIYADALGVGSLSPIQAEQVRHAAQLAAMAELARARLVEGDTSTINDVIRLENSAGRAFKALGIREAEPAAKPQSTPLADYLSKRGPSCER